MLLSWLTLNECEHTKEEQVTVEGAMDMVTTTKDSSREKRSVSEGGPEKDGEAKRQSKTTEEHADSDEDI